MMNLSIADSTSVPQEIQTFHDVLYQKIKAIVAGHTIDLRNDPTTMRILLESAMVFVEKLKGPDGTGYSGPEKKKIAITVVKWVISDLAKDGIIPADIAAEVNLNIDFFGGVAIDLAIAGAKQLYDVGQKVVAKIEANAIANTDPVTGKKTKCCWCF